MAKTHQQEGIASQRTFSNNAIPFYLSTVKYVHETSHRPPDPSAVSSGVSDPVWDALAIVVAPIVTSVQKGTGLVIGNIFRGGQ